MTLLTSRGAVSQKKNWDFAQEAMQYNWSKYQQSLTDYPEKWSKLEEPFVERILQNIFFNEYKVTQMDTGLVSSMYDFLVEKDSYRIAVEVTQHTNRRALESLAFLKNEKCFQDNSLHFDWTLTLHKHADISKGGRKKLVQLLQK